MKRYPRHSPDILVETLGLDRLQSLAIIGMGKNAGKTTVLNHLLEAVRQMKRERVVAVTSIGLDGEEEDLVTGGVKPRIYLSNGMLLATARGSLSKCDAVVEILALTGIHTAAGEIAIGRTRTNGYVELAGPSVARDLATCEQYCREVEKDCLFIVDGALSRKSSAGGGLTESVILVAGAANAPSLEELALETARQVSLLTLPPVSEHEKKKLLDVMEEFPSHRAIFLSAEETEPSVLREEVSERSDRSPEARTIRSRSLWLRSIIGEGKTIAAELQQNDTVLLLRGAITDKVLEPLLSEGSFVNITLAAEDGTRFFLGDRVLQQLKQRSVNLAVLSELSLPLICINPMRKDGSMVRREEMLETIESVVDIPVCELGPAIV